MEHGERLDVALVRRGLADSRERAQGLILAGLVTVAGQTKPSLWFAGDRPTAADQVSPWSVERENMTSVLLLGSKRVQTT